MSVHTDRLSAVGLAFLLFIVASYFTIVWRVYANLRKETEKLSVLVVRLALFLPLYAFFIYLGLFKPHALDGLNIPISVIEGYSFYGFFCMIVYNLGGPANTVKIFRDVGKPLICCNSCCPADHIRYYKKATWAMWHLVVTRVIIVILSAIGFYSGTRGGNAASALLGLAAAIVLFYCLAHLVLMYENIFNHCTNLFGVMKFFLIKFSVGLIVLQDIILSFLVAFNSEPYTDDSQYTAEDKTIRGYCFLILLEFCVLCFPYLYAFTYTISDPPQPIHDDSVTMDTNFCQFFCKVLNVFDIFGTLTLTPEDEAALAKFDGVSAGISGKE